MASGCPKRRTADPFQTVSDQISHFLPACLPNQIAKRLAALVLFQKVSARAYQILVANGLGIFGDLAPERAKAETGYE